MKFNTEKYLKKEIERYRNCKKLWEVIVDTDHPLNKKVRNELTIEQITRLANYIKQREDEGLNLLAYDIN